MYTYLKQFFQDVLIYIDIYVSYFWWHDKKIISEKKKQTD